jgi:hypothetical protein
MYLLFVGSLTYCYCKLYLGSGLFPVPFEYFTIGLGLISFAKIIKGKKIKEFKNDHRRQEFIISKTGNLTFLDKTRQENS